jgi:anaerobic magnesium-protoporphyrin IX monomethyl ester cyclase
MDKSNENSEADVMLIGYESQENMGLRSIISFLNKKSYRAVLVPFVPGSFDYILLSIKHFKPSLVGFSIIFQYTLQEFGNLIKYLRENDVHLHFTAGGHFPSLQPEETMELIPGLDSIVRFEGEETLLELLEKLGKPESWAGIPGLAFRNDDSVVVNENRPLLADLDTLPPIFRDEPITMWNGLKMAAMLASRGCLFNCSFCSIREFYGTPSGQLRRSRSPQSVVSEMLSLYKNKNVSFFSFQDDDFAARTSSQRKWLGSFLKELDSAGLKGKIAWKISCRVDDLNQEVLSEMMSFGLAAVYLGVESGNETGLKTLNKNVSVSQNISAIELLKQNNIAMATGFMLFDPSSTFDTIKQNIDFLRKAGEDGYFPVNFCKMLPYAGTPVEKMLKSQGRLKGTVTQPDYAFNDPQLDWFEFFVQKAFSQRNFSPDGIVALLQQVDFEWRIASYFDKERFPKDFGINLRKIIKETNMLALNTLDTLYDDIILYGAETMIDNKERLIGIFEKEWKGEMMAEVNLRKLCSSVDLLCGQESFA